MPLEGPRYHLGLSQSLTLLLRSVTTGKTGRLTGPAEKLSKGINNVSALCTHFTLLWFIKGYLKCVSYSEFASKLQNSCWRSPPSCC